MIKSFLPILFLLLLFNSCQTTSKEKTISTPPTANARWMNSFNKNKDSLEHLYFKNANKINSTGQIIVGAKAITKVWQEVDGKINSIQVLKKVKTHQEDQYEYEIGEFKNSKNEIFKHLIIWNKTEKLKKRELEFVAKAKKFASNKNEIDARRKEWITLCNNHNAKELVHQLYAKNAIYYNHKPVLVGRELISKDYSYMNQEIYQLLLTPIHLEEVTEDLAFEIGQCSGTYGGKYMIVWQKNKDGKWYVLMDSNI